MSEKRPFKASDTLQKDFIPCPAFGLVRKDAKIYDFEEEYHLNKTRLIVTRAFDSGRTPQDAFVRAILNSDKYEKNLHVSGRESIIKTEGLVCNQPDSHDEGRNR